MMTTLEVAAVTAICLVKITKYVNRRFRTYLRVKLDMQKANHSLDSLGQYWQQKRGRRTMPARRDLPVKELKPWLGNLALIDVRAENPIFRLCGTKLLRRFGFEVTGQSLDCLREAESAALRVAIEKIRKIGEAVRATFDLETPPGKTTFYELYLPLGDDGITMDTVLFASFPAEKEQ